MLLAHYTNISEAVAPHSLPAPDEINKETLGWLKRIKALPLERTRQGHKSRKHASWYSAIRSSDYSYYYCPCLCCSRCNFCRRFTALSKHIFMAHQSSLIKPPCGEIIAERYKEQPKRRSGQKLMMKEAFNTQ